MPALANMVITKVWPGKSGVGTYGPWQAYNFKVTGREEKFGYFGGGSKPTPVEGMLLEVLQYETVQNGEYTNHNVKIFQPAKGQAAPTPTQPATSAPTPSQGATSGYSAPVVDRKSVKIGMYAVLKAAGTIQHKDVFGLWKDAEELFKMVEDFTNSYQPPRQDIKQINAMLDSRDIVEDAFWAYACGLVKVDRNTELTPKQTQQIINEFDKAVASFMKAEVGVEEAQEDRRDTGERCPESAEGPEFTHEMGAPRSPETHEEKIPADNEQVPFEV